jgi:hypothetical protein
MSIFSLKTFKATRMVEEVVQRTGNLMQREVQLIDKVRVLKLQKAV